MPCWTRVCQPNGREKRTDYPPTIDLTLQELNSGDYSCHLRGMLIVNRDFTDEIVERIRVAVRGTADLTRCALSRMVCAWMDWHGFDGRAKEASYRAALLKLER